MTNKLKGPVPYNWSWIQCNISSNSWYAAFVIGTSHEVNKVFCFGKGWNGYCYILKD